MSSGTAVRSALLVLATIAACKDGGSHIYAGRLFEPARNCLDEASSVDVVDGPNPGYSCELKCIVIAAPTDGGAATDPPLVYVSSMCPPYPTFSDTTGTRMNCDQALAASRRSDICQTDGGTSNPLPPDAGPDAAPDAADAADASQE